MFAQISNIPYSNIHGVLEAVQPLEEVEIKTEIGSLVPVYKVEDQGRMKLTPVKLDTFGRVKSMQLQTATDIETSVGLISAEFVTFYPNGKLRRLFPLNGKLSGYWSEENEYKLAKTITIPSPIGDISVKPIYVHFYETGELKSITFWPKERITIQTPVGLVKVKTGLSFYKSGKLKSFEPDSPIEVTTPIGNIVAFDPDPIGINGEKNSLSFSEDGQVINISTVDSEVRVVEGYKINRFTPYLQRSRCNDELFVVQPLKVEIQQDTVIFRQGFKTIGRSKITSLYQIEQFEPETENSKTQLVESCH